MAISLRVNGRVLTAEVPPEMPLLWVLRDELGLKGTKFGCGVGACGACTVHVDGAATRACLTPVGTVGSRQITTIEGLHAHPNGPALQTAWIAHDVPQCGYCQAGQMMTAAALLKDKARPTRDEIEGAMTGNLCRCGCYDRIHAAINTAAGVEA
ncbi:MAG TPA: (2Fe-2S)-binding protein [Caulobacteraceae bacterium]